MLGDMLLGESFQDVDLDAMERMTNTRGWGSPPGFVVRHMYDSRCQV